MEDCHLVLIFLDAAYTSSYKYIRIQNSLHSGPYLENAYVEVVSGLAPKVKMHHLRPQETDMVYQIFHSILLFLKKLWKHEML